MLSDRELLDHINDPLTAETGFRLLVNQYQRQLYAHIRRITGSHTDTDDVLQETFIKAWKAIGSYRKEAALFHWLLAIATNEALSHLRKQRIVNMLTPAMNIVSVSAQPVSEPAPDGLNIERQFIKAFATLSVKQKAVFSLRYYDQMPFNQIAHILNKPEGTVKATWHQATEKLKKQLTGNES
ncbi:MAG TPA: RNA polymerase sigma factor [Bacteroidales bacterium]|nr:RNA polymerase sigma factor [Bacteroidales bacterium]